MDPVGQTADLIAWLLVDPSLSVILLALALVGLGLVMMTFGATF